MNFLAHLVLAGEDEGLRLGAMLGDFVRGRQVLERYDENLRRGILLHRHIDAYTDSLPAVAELRECFEKPFRRYAGIVIDLAFDHELARHWESHSLIPLEDFDGQVRDLLRRNDALVPEGLRRFMAYADRRGLFAAYRFEDEILHSLRGIGKRLKRPNPLHRVDEIWTGLAPRFAAGFPPVFTQLQSEVTAWLNSRSTITGS